MFSRRAGGTTAFSRGTLSTMEVEVSARIQNFAPPASLAAGAVLMDWVLWRRASAPGKAGPLPTRREWRNALVAGTLMLGGGMELTATGFASEMLCGGAVLMPVSLALGEQFSWPAQSLGAAAWLYLVVFGSLIAFSAYLCLLANAASAMATSHAFVNPLIALFPGVAWASESVTGGEWIASGVALVDVFLIFRGKTGRNRE